MIPGMAVLAGLWSRASSGLMIGAAIGGALMIAFGLGWWQGSTRSALRAEIAALQARIDAADRDLAIAKAHADRVAADAERRAAEAERRAADLQAFIDAAEAADANVPNLPERPETCPPCRDRVGNDDARRLRDLAR